MDAKNACNGGKANGSYLDNGRANEFQSACSIRYVHDQISRTALKAEKLISCHDWMKRLATEAITMLPS